jgi:hypothetical protein
LAAAAGRRIHLAASGREGDIPAASKTVITPCVPNWPAMRTQHAAREACVRSSTATTSAALGERPFGRGGRTSSGMSTREANMSHAASSNASLSAG